MVMTRGRRRRRRRLALLLLGVLAHPKRHHLQKVVQTLGSSLVSKSSFTLFYSRERKMNADPIPSFELEKTSLVKSRHSRAGIARSSRPTKMPRKSSTTLKPPLVEKDHQPSEDDDKEDEDRHAVETLRRLEDLGVSMPSNCSPETLRNHRHRPAHFVAIASQLAAAIEPLIPMTGADNPTLARRSCETLTKLGPGTSEEDRASRALGALAVLAVGQRYCIQFPTF